MRQFFTLPETKWKQPFGKLHLYIVPSAEVRDLADAYAPAMQLHRDLISAQPLDSLHLTVQMIERHLDEVSEIQLVSLQVALQEHLAGLKPFELTGGPAIVGVHGVTLYVPPPATGFAEVVACSRAAITEALGPDAVAPLPEFAAPHLALGYGCADADSDPLLEDVKHVWAAPVSFIVEEVQLVAVDQDVERGIFTWQPISVIELGRG